MIRSAAALIAAALAAASLGAAAADPSPADTARVSEAFGNTIISTYPDGRTAELWLKPGGAYSAKGRRGDPSSGHWTVKGAKLCLKQSRPLPMFINYCTPIPDAGMGHAWSAKAVTGEPIRVQLVKGDQA
ncbi:MAG: hypothetical protein JO303_14210 [Caulobacteraceae bacterium]|nr:hypothetical protein [Caulobacteraceae bacterium]